jgi:hypothetical protein
MTFLVEPNQRAQVEGETPYYNIWNVGSCHIGDFLLEWVAKDKSVSVCVKWDHTIWVIHQQLDLTIRFAYSKVRERTILKWFFTPFDIGGEFRKPCSQAYLSSPHLGVTTGFATNIHLQEAPTSGWGCAAQQRRNGRSRRLRRVSALMAC